MTESERRAGVVADVLGSLLLEGLIPSPEALADAKEYVACHISADELVSRATKRVRKSEEKARG